MQTLLNIASIAFLVFGFGFVIFWHELGHFLAAKAVGIKVEQFAVGMGSAILSWRKGLGLTVGSSAEKYQSKILSEWEKRKANNETLASNNPGPTASEELKIATDLGLGETEYRLNYLPLGGYVKMLGQDDMDFAVRSADPRAYTSKSIPARMFVVSAGVIMNIILAAILFTFLFNVLGFNAPPAIVGGVSPNSPAAKAGILPGDRILSINGSSIGDFTKLQLGVVLLPEHTAVPIEVDRNGQKQTLTITPEKSAAAGNVLALGIQPTPALRGLKYEIGVKNPEATLLPDLLAIKPGEVVTAINEQPITPELPAVGRKQPPAPSQHGQFLAALDASDGKPVILTVESNGAKRDISVNPLYPGDSLPFTGPLHIAGILPRPMIASISEESSAHGKLLPGDVVTSLTFDQTADVVPITSEQKLRDTIKAAGASGQPFTLSLARKGTLTEVKGITANVKLPTGNKGLGVAIYSDAASNVVGDVLPDTPAARAGLTPGTQITAVNGAAVHSLFELRRALLKVGSSAELTAAIGDKTSTHTLNLAPADLSYLTSLRPVAQLALDERIEPRKTDNPIVAMKWGVYETRDLIVKGYLTLKRIFERTVPASMMNGPVGIFHVGGKIATEKSIDWTFWFLAMISANLAVVNFLPIPIVDGGLFLFLILEKIMGRPLSPKTQQIIQLAGLALIASVFLFVTYNDITRLLS